METNERMDELFNRARTQAPKTSYSQASEALNVSIIAAAGGGILKKWAALSLKFKTLIMITAISIITVTSALVVSTLSTTSSNETTERQSLPMIQTLEDKTINPVENDTRAEINVSHQEQQPEPIVTQEKLRAAVQTPNLEKLSLTMISPDGQWFNKNLAAPYLVKGEKNAQDSLKMKMFEISEKTTNQEIENIKQQALDAGLEFDFSTKVRQDKIKKLDLHMKKGTNKWMSKISGTDSFSFTFGWWENSEGQYVKFICDDDLARICGDCD